MSQYQQLFDIVESDKLIVFTGAGFSRGFKRSDGSMVPGWIDLLIEIKARFDSEGIIVKDLAGNPADSLITKFMDEPFPRGENLIEVATILRRADHTRFDVLVEELLTPQYPPDPVLYAEYEKKHKAIMALQPKGIITVNVDKFHENYLNSNGYSWTIHDPINGDEFETIGILSRLEESPFLIKAHGTIGRKIVFDYLAYRDLIEKSPAYNSLFIHLFSHYRILFIGFGLSDLDFDLTIEKIARKIGVPIQQHLTIQVTSNNRRTAKSRIGKAINVARMARLEERFGIISLEMNAIDIPPLLEKAASVPGSRLIKLIDECISSDLDIRKRAHLDLRLLGTVGKRIAMNYIYEKVLGKLRALGSRRCKSREIHDLSELTYSLGSIGLEEPSDIRSLSGMLIDIIENTKECEIVAHALWALFAIAGYVDGIRLKDLRISGHINNLLEHRDFKAPKERCSMYLDALIARIDAEALS
ncbi:SIR2 family protein [Desulforegula conservatrix]|uniref:SIR2 family protein n=1 Tax=Desulforegula conservatrix TaxID=153026 RepID=UPI0004086B7D|nr:SIR2 family protein [Desulforegula conservatrix]